MMATLVGVLLSFSWTRTSESAHCFHSQVEELQESNDLSGMAEDILARHNEEVCRRTEECIEIRAGSAMNLALPEVVELFSLVNFFTSNSLQCVFSLEQLVHTLSAHI